MERLKEILLESDVSLASFMMGAGLIMWGVVAIFMAPTDFFTFASSMKFLGTWFWFINYTLVGSGFIYAAIKKFPPFLSLCVGGYAALIWTWIASIRGFSNFTSGVTLNIIVIVMGILLVQRSGTK